MGFLSFVSCCSCNKSLAPKETRQEPEPSTCPLCLMFEVFYAPGAVQGNKCKKCAIEIDRGVLCSWCSDRDNACYFCGISAQQDWAALIDKVSTKEIKNISAMVCSTTEEEEYKENIRLEWDIFRKVWQQLLEKRPSDHEIMHLRGEYDRLHGFLIDSSNFHSDAYPEDA
eukprot:CAMPEP_0196657408 /NCGR_PEP_ID=MMETSP1086-20130531/23180_1 /TAXON_ID=77921 /ORGANISM="Cyanoptyche  gloeocystis , Strain SAG4.97" /LENGTH=169 /DNA_ID=CAMNT_0041990507 /DNA_START=61 /DNA_END=570 /DNA_ORIENTATION=+